MNRQINFLWPLRSTQVETSSGSCFETAPKSLKTLWFGVSLAALIAGDLGSAFAQEASPPQMLDTLSQAVPANPTVAPVPAVQETQAAVADPSSEVASGKAISQPNDAPATVSSTQQDPTSPTPAASIDAVDSDATASIKDSTTQTAPSEETEPTISTEKAAASQIAALTTGTKSVLPQKMQDAIEKLVFAEAKPPHAADTQKRNEAIAAFYTMRDFAPLWTAHGEPTPAAKAVIEQLRHAPDDGLDFVILPELKTSNDDDAVKADLALTEAVITYAQTAAGSRIDPKTISPLIGEKPETPEPFDILSAVSAAGDTAGHVLLAYNPPQKGYQALREKLAELRRENAPVAHQAIPFGPELTVGMRDPRVTLIRARFGLDVQQHDALEELVYDTRVAAAVAGFQKTAGLPVSGVLTARTIAALSGGQPSRLEDEILANMERWRWMPRDMGETYIAVNIPDFTVAVIRDDQVLTRHRVVVGKPDTPTPVFSNQMKYLIVNPYWNVPQSIIHKEFLPKGGGDLGYLSAAGWEVSSHHGQLVVRQPPGEKNALGHIKFLFPNDYSVYLHDTPSRGLFASAKRAFSHGCVRVDQPFSFAESVLNHSWSEQRLKGLIGSTERYINLPTPLPIHIEYFTTYVDETGRLQLRDDLYDYSHKVKVALTMLHCIAGRNGGIQVSKRHAELTVLGFNNPVTLTTNGVSRIIRKPRVVCCQ
jgi:murein L,D-transpeptidase YcbB/YkuD